MHIDVSELLQDEVGAQASFKIADETPALSEITLTSPIQGNVRLIKTDEGLVASGQASSQLRLDCHRCLRAFSSSFTISFEGEYSLDPREEQWPIAEQGLIDLAPLIEQELIVSLPIKQLCQQECPGLCDSCGQPLDDKHVHHQAAPAPRWRITKTRKE